MISRDFEAARSGDVRVAVDVGRLREEKVYKRRNLSRTLEKHSQSELNII